MYVLEYMVYHLKAYGYDTIVKMECDKDEAKGNNPDKVTDGQSNRKGDKLDETTDGQTGTKGDNQEYEENPGNENKPDKRRSMDKTVLIDNQNKNNLPKNTTSEIKKIQSNKKLLNNTEKSTDSLLKKTLLGSFDHTS